MAQAGDPTGTGLSGSRYLDLKAEFTDTPLREGLLEWLEIPVIRILLILNFLYV